MKRKQKNWLKERSEDMKTNATCIVTPKKPPANKCGESVKSSTDLGRDHSNTGSNLHKQVREVNNTLYEQGSEKFKSWIKSRNSQSEEDTSVESNPYETLTVKCSNTAARKVSCDGESADPLPDANPINQPTTRVHSRLISPEQFNELADKIVSKVKTDLNISEKGFSDEIKKDVPLSEMGYLDQVKHELQISEKEFSYQMKKDVHVPLTKMGYLDQVKRELHISEKGFSNQMKRDVPLTKMAYLDQVKRELQISEKGFSNQMKKDVDVPLSTMGYLDQVQQELQISETGFSDQQHTEKAANNANTGVHDRRLSSHQCGICFKLMVNENEPMLLIPCGHSLCKCCCEGLSVCPIGNCSVSSQVVNLTLQQIIQQYQSNRRRTGRPPRNISYSPNKYTETKETNYHDKLEMLLMRQEVLKEEIDSEVSVYTELSTELHKEEEQLDNIGRQETSVSKQISSLKEKLTILQQNKAKCESHCSQLKTDFNSARKCVSMLKDTIVELTAEIDKVRLLSEGSCLMELMTDH